MANNKIYNLLPVHLQNKELETIFDSTLERAFSAGSVTKTKAFIGRKEKGVYNDNDAYVSFPDHLFQRDNYGLEPVFSNTNIGDNIYYDDLLNSMYNKGSLTNDHRRLFKSDTYTINLPIDIDKFCNWELYYWVNMGFTSEYALYEYKVYDSGYSEWIKQKPYILNGEPGTDNLAPLINAKVAPKDDFAEIGDYAVVISKNQVVYWIKTVDGWARLGTSDTSSPTFTQSDIRPVTPSAGDTYVNTSELRITLLLGENNYILRDTIQDRWNIEVNPYALRFPNKTQGIINLIEYRENPETSTPDWEIYTELANVFSLGNSNDTHYITIDKNDDTTSSINWWSDRNSWYHYDDIRQYINDENKSYIIQAKRPIIEFDRNIELSDSSQAAVEWEVPTFKVYDSELNTSEDSKIFHYVEDEDSIVDKFLSIQALLTPGDYQSEFTFNIDLADNVTYKINDTHHNLYIITEFDYRNLRHEYGKAEHSILQLLQEAKTDETIDVYVEGIKQIDNYTVFDGKFIIFNSPVTGYVYVDFTTKDNVVIDGDTAWQRIDPALEYNPDNETHNDRNFTYSTVFEHFKRQIETSIGLTGNQIAVNNYRNIGDNTDKLRHNKFGSIMVRNSIDIKKAYFAITRDDYNPYTALEYIATAYNSYKNNFINNVQEILNTADSETMSDSDILEQAVSAIALAKRQNISVFDGSMMINAGDTPTHYITAKVNPIVAGAKTQFIPSSVATEIVYNDNISILINGKIATDYKMLNEVEVEFDRTIDADDVIEVRYYTILKETFIPPSATKLGLNAVYKPRYITDTEYDEEKTFLVGHDGSKTLIWGDRTDDITLMFESLVYNRIEQTESSTSIKKTKYGMYRNSTIEYSLNEKKYIMYPFFKKWMLRNNIDNLYNTDYNADDYKTWNYRARNDASPGYWRGIFQYAYGTDHPTIEPWVTVGYSIPPEGFEMNSGRYTQYEFWEELKSTYSTNWPIPIDENGDIRTIDDLFFNSQTTLKEIELMNQDWEFGDGSPIEQAWRRSSEYSFIEFLMAMIAKPFEIIDLYSDELNTVVNIFHQIESIDTDRILKEQEGYEFKLGSKLGGFVNNFKLNSEKSGLSNSRYAEIPRDNYDLFIHSGEPNRSESFSAIVLEKVSLDVSYPTYNIDDTATYQQEDIVYNPSDNRYYVRKVESATFKEITKEINFDYTAWTLIAQPKIKKFGYRINGYDDFNPQFFTLNWDITSGEKLWKTQGDEAIINDWQANAFYKQDTYVVYQGVPYISLYDHNSSASFNDDQDTYWKILESWPRVNRIVAKGYKDTFIDQLKTHNYGDILYSVDDVAQLLIGYQNYLTTVGWSFTDINDSGESVNFESLLIKFLEWTAEQHEIGEFITLTPILLTGSFSAPYGIASVQRENNKNFYKVLDSSGRQIPSTAIKFFSEGDSITWESVVPVYGMKIDIVDIEHAFVVDRIDNFGDVIYDPINHNRNLRMMIDCNRTDDWNGTLGIDGYIVQNNTLNPNFETMISDTKFYRDTMVDQSLSNINLIKASHIGFTPRSYLSNHMIERESQLEFYKGFISDKGTPGSINKIINNNSNFSDIGSDEVWALKLDSYGNLNRNISISKDIETGTIFTDPYTVTYDSNPFLYRTTPRTTPIKTTGYVNSRDVNYVVRNSTILETTVSENYYEGDLAWIQFDTLRDWDVRRLSEVAQIVFVGETEDSQLYIVLINEIDVTDTVYLRINNEEIDPELNGYYYLIEDGTIEASDGTTVFKYLVFDTDFEPIAVEIDTTTDNSVFVPSNDSTGVEAISLNSNPNIIDGETLVINNTSFVFDSNDTAGSTSALRIGGDNAAIVNPVVTPGDKIDISVFDQFDNQLNAGNSIVTFTGTVAQATNNVTAQENDTITIDDVNFIVSNIDTGPIVATSGIDTSDSLPSGSELIVTGDTSVAYTAEDIVISGTVSNPQITSPTSIIINDDTIIFTPVIDDAGTASDQSDDTVIPFELSDIIDTINASTNAVNATLIDNKLVLTSTEPSVTIQGSTAVDILGLIGSSPYTETKLGNLAVQINTQANISAALQNNKLEISRTGNTMSLSGEQFAAFNFDSSDFDRNLSPTTESIKTQINDLNIANVTASISDGKLKLTSSGISLQLSEVTDGAMARLGFNSTSITVNSLENIISDINSSLTTVTFSASNVDDRLLISGNEYKINISNVLGTPLTAVGIVSGEYISNIVLSQSAIQFISQINEQSDSVSALITSDGRIVINVIDQISLSFEGTSQLLLDKIGLYTEYSNVSNINFKVMRWKSVRYTPGYNGESFDEFYRDLGLNDTSRLWVDNYTGDDGWAVILRNTVGSLQVLNRKAKEVDVDLIDRVIIKEDDTEFKIHNLYDPLNLKLPGSIMKDIDYISWNDPSKYDEFLSSGLWLDEHLGEIWWDTNSTRYYRYNDYGDANGNIIPDYTKRFWGKIVDGSVVEIKQWVKNEILPAGITWFNTKKEWNDAKNKEVTTYFYWTSIGTLPRYNKEYSTDEIRMIIETGSIKNKFIPINSNTIVLNNKVARSNKTITVTTEYQDTVDRQDKHTDWEMISRESDKPIMADYLERLKNSIANSKISNKFQVRVNENNINVNGAIVKDEFLLDLDIEDISVSVNNEFLEITDFTIDGDELIINNNRDVIKNDVVRVYELENISDNLFENVEYARENFKVIINTFFNNKLLSSEFPFYEDYIKLDHYIFNSTNWYIDSDYETITSYQYLGNTRNIDMRSMANSGIRSFKIKNPDYEEFYFPYGNLDQITLVNKKDGSMNLNFDDILIPGQTGNGGESKYYTNVISTQLHEFIDMIYYYGKTSFIKDVFFDMLNYLYTENEHPEWLFKTSYIDLTLLNKPLRQYAIYQNDTYTDTIEYIMEAKPYHTKLRHARRIYPLSEDILANVDTLHHMKLTIDLGGDYSRYDYTTYDGGIAPDDEFLDIKDGKYDTGKILRNPYSVTADKGGIDTGLVDSQILESTVLRIDEYSSDITDGIGNSTLDKKTFVVYDTFGSGHLMHTIDSDTVASVSLENGYRQITVTDASKFKTAVANSVILIAVENSSGKLEFMHYSEKNDATIHINERSLFTGLAVNIEPGDTIYIMSAIEKIAFLAEQLERQLI